MPVTMCHCERSAGEARGLIEAALRIPTGQRLLAMAGYHWRSIDLAELTDADALRMAGEIQRAFDSLYPRR